MSTEFVSEFEKLSIERKEMVAKGEVPEWYITQGYLMFTRKYAYKGETVKGCFTRIAKTLAKHVSHILPDAEQKFFDLMWSGKLAPATPVMTNTGTDRGDPVSCSGGYIGDSVNSFYDHFKEVAVLSKHGYGCSGYFGDIRSRGSSISTGGVADGPVEVLDRAFSTVKHISQGENRRGNYAGYFEADTPDFKEIIGYVHKNKGFANIGWNVRDGFIDRLKAGDKEAVSRWNDILYTRAADSKGYITKPDHAQRLAPQAIKNSGISLKGSNMCVAPETKVLTKDGEQLISTLENQSVEVWNGEEWSEIVVKKTGVDQKLLRVRTTDTFDDLYVTEYHKWYIVNENGEVVEKRTHELVQGDVTEVWTKPDGYDSFHEIMTIEDEGRVDDTYCFTEPKRGRGVFNGVLTGNCSEIWLPQDEDHTFSCVLSSLNLAMWDQITDDDIFNSIVFLDCVVEEMLTKARGRNGFDKIVRFTEKSRALGIGSMGFHSYLQSKMIAFEDLETILINRQIFDRLDDVTLEASQWLAEKLGEPEWCKGTGLRNATRMAIAPNTSSALLCGGVSQGIEPYVTNAYNQATAAGEMTRMNPYFVELAKSKGKYSVEMMRDIAINHDGSVQHLDWLTDREKLVFRTAFEIDQFRIIMLASQRQKNERTGQKGVDQGQSLNLFFWEDEEYVARVVQAAILDENIKGLYYQRSMRGIKGSTGMLETTECVNCEG